MCKSLNDKNLVVILTGTNDVANNNSNDLLLSMKNKLWKLMHIKVLVVEVLHWYDLIPGSLCQNGS